MNNIVKEISRKKNLEKNIPLFADYIGSLYYQFANVCLSMNYYTFYEMIEDGVTDKTVLQLAQKVTEIVNNGVLSDNSSYDAISSIEDIRARIINTMKVLTSYADIFDRYEYILNRVEYRFREEEIPKQYTDENFTKKLMRYIVAEEDSVIINSRISEVIAELPMRMTKSKFFERLNEGINVYRDTDKKSLEDFLYMISSSAMLELPDEKNDIFDELKSIHRNLADADYPNITAEEYADLKAKFNYAAAYIQDTVNLYMMMQQVVNHIYAILLTKPYVKDCGSIEEKESQNIIRYISKGISPDETIENSFIALEGKQEQIHEEYSSCEYILDDTKKQLSGNIHSKELKEQYQVLYKAQVLLSESLFVEFDGNTIDDSEMSTEYFEQRKRKFLEETEQFLNSHDRTVNRAVMAAMISSLPVFFNNLEELQDYIYNALDSCRQKEEKMACIEILNSAIETITDYRKED